MKNNQTDITNSEKHGGSITHAGRDISRGTRARRIFTAGRIKQQRN